jgi:hypothetical protein
MNTQPESDDILDPAKTTNDQTRRKLTTAGIAGTGVLLSVASRSAMGGWGQCTGSELASGNLSRTGDQNPCGCSPGFWWNNNGEAIWTDPKSISLAPYPPSSKFNTVFGKDFFLPTANVTLAMIGPGQQNPIAPALNSCNNNLMNVVAMHAVAALLNAAYYGNRYPVIGMQTPGGVISAFQTAFNGGCSALETFKNTVDIYGKTADLWCSGSPENG